MAKEKIINILKYSLLAFTLITIGFAIGKEVTLRRVQLEAPSSGTVSGDKVVVYYAHATIRCVSCETIERLTHETLDEQFSEAVAAGRLAFKEVNFQEDSAFAKQYEIVANCVIVSQVKQGQEVRHQRLDEVWDLYEDPPAFKQFLGDAIRAHLENPNGGDV
ncbi:MAG: hypothetical protein HQ515_02150 [Phycisphaeraceae bacterium]|nr:hypothetical protein [Phycisphaeraceae bacterium]